MGHAFYTMWIIITTRGRSLSIVIDLFHRVLRAPGCMTSAVTLDTSVWPNFRASATAFEPLPDAGVTNWQPVGRTRGIVEITFGERTKNIMSKVIRKN